jgi:nucleotide-binding universal stress UspA family protein
MSSLSHILATTDLTGRSVYALQRAVQIKRESDAQLTVMHVVEHGLTKRFQERYCADALSELQAWKRSLHEISQLGLEVKVAIGDPFSTIVDLVGIEHIDMAVLGGPGKGGLKELFTGTTVERVIRLSDTPVLMVTQHASGPYKRVVVAVDFSRSAQRAVQWASRIAPNADISLIHAWQPAIRAGGSDDGRADAANQRLRDQELTQLRALVASNVPERPFDVQMIEDEPCRAIRRAVATANAELLVMGTHGRGRIASALIGSVAQELLATPPCDVLVVKG